MMKKYFVLVLFISGCFNVNENFCADINTDSLLNLKVKRNLVLELKKAELYRYNQKKIDCDDCTPSIPFEVLLINKTNDTAEFYLGFNKSHYEYKPRFYQISKYCDKTLVFQLEPLYTRLNDPSRIAPFDTLKIALNSRYIPYELIVKGENENYYNGMNEIAQNTRIIYTLDFINDTLNSNIITHLISDNSFDFEVVGDMLE